MRRKIIRVACVVLILFGGLWVRRSVGSSSSPQKIPAPCSIIVTSNSGEYVGSGTDGMDFKGRATLRFVNQLTCGSKSTPNNYSAIRKK